MNKPIYLLLITCILFLPSCSKKLTSITDRTPEQISATYEILEDVSYGADNEQKMDIYLSTDAKSYGKNNYTIIFIHGGGYYLSDKKSEERYIEPYLRKGMNVVNMNYRLKRGIPLATADLTNVLNFLSENNNDYQLNLKNIILTGFSAGAHMATIVAVSQNNPEYPNKLKDGIKISAAINFAGPVDGLDIVEKVFMDHEYELFRELGNALFPENDAYESKEKIAVYEAISYFDINDPPIFIWHSGKDDQVPPETFKDFVPLLNRNKDYVLFKPEGLHSPNKLELNEAYTEIFKFLDNL